MEKTVSATVVIGRQFGCGGRETGKALAKTLNIPYYDGELLIETAREFGLCDHVLNRGDEHRPSLLSSFPGLVLGSFSGNYCHRDLSPDNLYDITSRTIQAVADKGPCVIVGRTADYVLRDRPELFSVFLHAPVDRRAERICRRGDCSSVEEARKMARNRDQERRNYYNYYTGRHWGAADNYHLSLDASTMTTPELVDLLTHYIEKRKR